jgi:tRNA A37 threonylcarbamoyladenosine modification protein TsaB
MSLKIAYITLKTVAVIRQIPLYGVSPFLFNGEEPIRGIGGGFFVKDKNGIMLQKSKDLKEKVLSLPDYSDFTSSKTDAEPFYMIDAV